MGWAENRQEILQNLYKYLQLIHYALIYLAIIIKMQGPTSSSSSVPKKQSTPDFDYTMKVIIIGDSGVGKSSLLVRYR